MKDAETGQRGYVITGDPGYLAPFAQAVTNVKDELAALRRLTREDPAQQERLRHLDALVAEKLVELDQTIRARTDQGFDAAAHIVATDRGKRLMDEIRLLVGTMRSEEDRLYAERAAREASESRAVLKTNVARVRRCAPARRRGDGAALSGRAGARARAGSAGDRPGDRRGHHEVGGVAPHDPREHR